MHEQKSCIDIVLVKLVDENARQFLSKLNAILNDSLTSTTIPDSYNVAFLFEITVKSQVL